MEKDEAIRSLNQFGTVGNLWRSARAMTVLAAISWVAPRVTVAVKMAIGYCMDLAEYVPNQHVAFLVWNVLAFALFVVCRRSGAGARDDCEAVPLPREAALPPLREKNEEETLPATESGGGDEVKQIVLSAAVTKKEIMQCDDVAAVIEKAARQIDRFQRTQSEKLKGVIAAPSLLELRRSEAEIRLTCVDSADSDTATMETLSNEEFQCRVDAFIEEHW